jgi:hypothetical protein
MSELLKEKKEIDIKPSIGYFYLLTGGAWRGGGDQVLLQTQGAWAPGGVIFLDNQEQTQFHIETE